MLVLFYAGFKGLVNSIRTADNAPGTPNAFAALGFRTPRSVHPKSTTIIAMSYLVPYHLALKPGEEVLFRTLAFPGEPDIPSDTYQLQEKYCANPACHCQEALLEVVSVSSRKWVADIRVSLDLDEKPNPRLDLFEDTAPYAQALFKQIAQNLNSDPSYLYRLRAHYNQIKAVAADPSHPAHATILQWGETGGQQPPANKRKRKRH